MSHIAAEWLKRTGGMASDMTLLDYFAANAMSGMLAFEGWRCWGRQPEGLAEEAYEFAAAMVAESEVKP